MPDVLTLIDSAAKRRQPTTSDILTLSSGGSLSSSGSTRKKSSTAAKSPTTKKKSSSGSSGRAKAPCKYGPRGADGYCPKKPASARAKPRNTGRNRTTVTARTPGSAADQAIDVVTNPRATDKQKAAAVGKVAEQAVGTGLKSAAKKAVRSSKFRTAKEKAVNIAKNYGASVPILGPLIIAGQTVASSGAHAKIAAASRKTDAALRKVETNLKRKLTKKERKILYDQHLSYYVKNPKAP